MNCLVTGGAGFVGLHLCNRLQLLQHNVTCLDNLSNFESSNRLIYLNKNVNVVISDVKHLKLDEVSKPDVIFHLGEFARVEESFNYPVQCLNDNNNLPSLLQECVENDVMLIYAGSSTKFAHVDEDGNVGSMQSPYAFSKAKNIELIRAYGKWYGLKYKIVYFYNVYGPHENSFGINATVVGKFIQQAKDNKSLCITSPGTQRRNFTHVEDIVYGIILVLNKGELGGEYGIGSSKSYSILELAKLISDDVIITPPRKGNRLNAETESINALRELGWSEKNDLKAYIKELKKHNWNVEHEK